jgi:hypothetical protein
MLALQLPLLWMGLTMSFLLFLSSSQRTWAGPSMPSSLDDIAQLKAILNAYRLEDETLFRRELGSSVQPGALVNWMVHEYQMGEATIVGRNHALLMMGEFIRTFLVRKAVRGVLSRGQPVFPEHCIDGALSRFFLHRGQHNRPPLNMILNSLRDSESTIRATAREQIEKLTRTLRDIALERGALASLTGDSYVHITESIELLAELNGYLPAIKALEEILKLPGSRRGIVLVESETCSRPEIKNRFAKRALLHLVLQESDDHLAEFCAAYLIKSRSVGYDEPDATGTANSSAQ